MLIFIAKADTAVRLSTTSGRRLITESMPIGGCLLNMTIMIYSGLNAGTMDDAVIAVAEREFTIAGLGGIRLMIRMRTEP
jgi:hypothetical protein